MWKLDCEESRAPKNWCFWTVVLEKTLVSPLDCKEIQPVHSEGGQPWVFFGRTDAKAKTPILWPPHAKSWLIGKDSDARRDWGQEEKGMTEDEMAGWHHRLNGHEFGWTPGVGDGQGGLACCNSWGHKELDTTERLNWTAYSIIYMYYSFFIHSSVYRHLGCFHCIFISIVNSTAVNTGVYLSFSFMIFSGFMPSSGIVGLYSSFIPGFLRSLRSALRSAVSVYILTNSARWFPFLHTLSGIYCL